MEPNLLTQFNFVAGMVPILETYLSEVSNLVGRIYKGQGFI